LAKLDVHGTPRTAIIVSAVFYSLFALVSFSKLVVADVLLYSLALFLEFGALVQLRKTEPSLRGVFRIPLGRTGVAVLAALAMMVDSVGQLIMTGVPGKELDAETARLFRRVQPGAFVLFGRNLESATQLQKLIDDLRDVSDIKPIITIDQEGGCVSRLRRIGNEPPHAQQLRDKHDSDLIRRHSNILGRLLRLWAQS